MSQTLTRLLVHFIFSTKNREPLITSAVESDLHAYLGGIARNLNSPAIAIGGMPDHVHLLVSLSKTLSAADFMLELKRESSKWIKAKAADLSDFAWQDGYCSLTIGESQVKPLISYIQNQREHHRVRSFQDEFLEFLERYGIAYDPRYIWR